MAQSTARLGDPAASLPLRLGVRPHSIGGRIPVRAHLPLLFGLSLIGCVLADYPKLRGCADDGGGLSHGHLAVFSGVPGLIIDSSAWSVSAYQLDFGAVSSIQIDTRLRTTARVPLESTAVVYTLRDPVSGKSAQWVDTAFELPVPRLFVDSGRVIFPGSLVLPSDTIAHIRYIRQLESGLITSRTLGTPCPVSIQAVSRRALVPPVR